MITLARSYVLGDRTGSVRPHGFCAAESTISSDHAYLQSFVAAFIAHPKNRLPERYGPICDELTRAGEILRSWGRRQELVASSL